MFQTDYSGCRHNKNTTKVVRELKIHHSFWRALSMAQTKSEAESVVCKMTVICPPPHPPSPLPPLLGTRFSFSDCSHHNTWVRVPMSLPFPLQLWTLAQRKYLPLSECIFDNLVLTPMSVLSPITLASVLLSLPAAQWTLFSYILFSWQLSLAGPDYWALVIAARGPGNPGWGCLELDQPIRTLLEVTLTNQRPVFGPRSRDSVVSCTGGIISLMTLHSPLQVSISPSLIVLTIAHFMSPLCCPGLLVPGFPDTNTTITDPEL